MSEKFGLDWREYDSTRMLLFSQIIGLYNEKEKREADRQSQGSHR